MPKADPKTEYVAVTDPFNTEVTFVNFVVASGLHNGVVNLTLAQTRFTPTPNGDVDPDCIIASRLRMDLQCAAQLRDQLNRVLGEAETQVRQALATTAVPGPSGKAS